MMLKDWNSVVTDQAETAGELQLIPEDGAAPTAEGKNSSEPWVDQAIEMFGEDLVVIKDE